MTKPKLLEQLRAEKERAETQLAQEQHKLERLENRKKYLEQCVQAAISTETEKITQPSGAATPEVLKTVWTMCWKHWYDCVSCAFHGFFEGEKESRRKALALFAPMPIHSSPQCELPQGFAGFGN